MSVPEDCRLTWIDYPDCDFFYWTQWELSDGDCFEDGPCESHCWLCTKYKAANGSKAGSLLWITSRAAPGLRAETHKQR